MNTLRVFTTFSGYDSQCLALDRLGIDYELVGWSEIDRYAIQAHNALYPQLADRNYGDITKIDWAKVPDFDLFTYSSPCFVAGTLVNTERGMIPIEEVRVGDKVLTHKNRYQKVLRTGNKVSNDLYRIKGMSFDEIVCTSNHPFYVREMYHYGHKSDRLFREPKWVEAKDLNKQTYCSVAINQESEMPKWNGGIDNRWGHHKEVNRLAPLFANPNFWYLMGRYVGDGWTRESNTGRSVIICCGGRNEERLQKAFANVNFHVRAQKERSVTKYVVCSNELYEFVKRYGYYAHGKEVDSETMALPIEMLSAFLDGYTDSDGCYLSKTRTYKYTTVSQKLVYGIAQCIAKVHRRPYAVYRTARPPKTVIEGRTVNQKDTFEVRFKKERSLQDRAFVEGDTIWFPVNKIERVDGSAMVFNLEVENDNSYTANGVIVHNCQDFSQAGLQRGGEQGSGTRSSLLWECERAIAAKKPKYLLMENVSALVSKKFIKLFNRWQVVLQGYGYKSFPQVLNAKDYGVPQNRERIFLVSILDEEARYEFPKKEKLTRRLKDVLETEVDEKYYLNDERVRGLLLSTQKEKDAGRGFAFEPKAGDDTANSVTGNAGSRKTDNFIQVVGDLQPDNLRPISGVTRQQNYVIGVDGGSMAITAEHARHPFKIAEPNERQDNKKYKILPNGNIRGFQDNERKSGISEEQYINTDNVAQTITTAHEPKIIDDTYKGREPREYAESAPNSRSANARFKVASPFRIRKLTPRECFRLMDVSESDIDKIQAADISNSQQYKLAGNSIVVAVLEKIFYKLFINTKQENEQLKLF